MIVDINDPTIATLAGLVGFDEFEPRARRSTLRVRGTVAYALATSLAKRHDWRHDWTDRVDALRILLCLPLTVASWLPAVGTFIDHGCDADQPVPLLLWIFAAASSRAAPPDPPPLAGADPAWLRLVVAAHGQQPWVMSLLAAMAASDPDDVVSVDAGVGRPMPVLHRDIDIS